MNPRQLDRFGLLALLCCCFSVCTTRPITQKTIADVPNMSAYEATPDKVDSLFLQIATVEEQGESLATRLSIAINQQKKERAKPRTFTISSNHPNYFTGEKDTIPDN